MQVCRRQCIQGRCKSNWCSKVLEVTDADFQFNLSSDTLPLFFVCSKPIAFVLKLILPRLQVKLFFLFHFRQRMENYNCSSLVTIIIFLGRSFIAVDGPCTIVEDYKLYSLALHKQLQSRYFSTVLISSFSVIVSYHLTWYQ